MPVSRSLQGMTASTRRGLEPPVENGSKKHLPIEAARYRFDFEQTFDHRFRSSCEQPDSRIVGPVQSRFDSSGNHCHAGRIGYESILYRGFEYPASSLDFVGALKLYSSVATVNG